jgi:DNA-binding MarR family transcriptional regulator
MSALVALEPGGQMDFIFLRNLLKATDGNLGAHLEKLEGADYIRIEKTFVAKKPRTFISVSDKGRDAFTQHIAALKLIIKTSKA